MIRIKSEVNYKLIYRQIAKTTVIYSTNKAS